MDTLKMQTVEYDSDAFPRLKLLQTRLKDLHTVSAYLPSKVFQPPCIRFFYDEGLARDLIVNNCQFSVNGNKGKCNDALKDGPIVTVFIVQADEIGQLTKKDTQLLRMLRSSVTEDQLQTVIFVLNTMQPDSQLKKCSEELSKALHISESKNTIFNRLFAIKSTDIAIRISLLFEKKALKMIPSKTDGNYELLESTLTSDNYNQTCLSILTNGLLKIKKDNKCLSFLQRAVMKYESQGESTYRLPWTIRNVKKKVNDFLCESLSKEITLILAEKIDTPCVTPANLTIIDFSPEWIIFKSIEMLIVLEVRKVPVRFGIGYGLLHPVEINDLRFRYAIAETMFARIAERQDIIIQAAIRTFRDVYLEYIKMHGMINVFAKRNRIDISFHEYKIVAERNSQIKACGLFGNTIHIYILMDVGNDEPIRRYLGKYNFNISDVNICDYQEIAINKHSFKSGSKLKLEPNLQTRYGTVSFPLKDANNRYYCATCKHSQGISCSHGIRTDDDEFSSGEILHNDMTPMDDSIVYKWGATTGLTLGKYKGLLCTRKGKTGSYDISTFIIDGQSEPFSREGDSGSLVCIKPDSVIYTRHMASFILIGEINKYAGNDFKNMHACYSVGVPLSEMKKTKLCKKIHPCFCYQ
ncbi:unnamed protein product [Mytilus coruscus]|uniref:Uncharacterized protein n=1 Tax=Mytilus coruscus TaxID=42192 RepID=A0A6J8D6S7_MYTCO|nr:unnamed protein product [Mytilus coruscus]